MLFSQSHTVAKCPVNSTPGLTGSKVTPALQIVKYFLLFYAFRIFFLFLLTFQFFPGTDRMLGYIKGFSWKKKKGKIKE